MRYVNSLIKVNNLKKKLNLKKFFSILICKKVNVYALYNQIFNLINKVFLNLLYIFLKFFFF